MRESKHYTPGDIRKMQRDAMQRVQTMRNKEKESVQNFNRAFNRNPPCEEEFRKTQGESTDDSPCCDEINNLQTKKTEGSEKNKSSHHSKANNFMDLILKDPEKTLLAVLILILLNENENPAIILSLIYILLDTP